MQNWRNFSENEISRKFLENEVLTSNPIKVTIMAYDWLLSNLQYVVDKFDSSDLESFESDQSLEKLDKAERLVEELHMQIAEFDDAPLRTIQGNYVEVIKGFQRFKENHNVDIIKGVIILIRGLKEGYEGVLEKGE